MARSRGRVKGTAEGKKVSIDPRTIPGARPASLPEVIVPQLATLVDEAPEGDSWLHEIKHDGYRALVRVEGGRARVFTRRGQDWTDRFPTIAARAAGLPLERGILDGEVVALKPDGTSSFQALQGAMGEGRDRDLVYYVFDLLHLDGYDLTGAGLEARKAALAGLLKSLRSREGAIRYSDHVAGNGPRFRREACRHAVEGVVSKRRNGPYLSGRGRDWLKSKCIKRQEFVICGYTEPSGSRVGLGSLILGAEKPEEGLVYAGRVGTGFSEKTLRDLHRRLRAIETATRPFKRVPPGAIPRGVHWVKPELVAEVEYIDQTRDGLLRHPSFQGLREDKDPKEVVLEGEAPAAPGPALPGVSGKDGAEMRAGVRLTSPDRVIYPEAGITKRGLAEFYEAISGRILPHLRDRPLSLVRCPEWAGAPCFFQKHASPSIPAALRRIPIREGRGKQAMYLAVDDLPGLISLVQIGVLEIHAWGSRADLLERPDRIVFDLDPDPLVPWKEVIAAARAVRERLSGLGLRSFVKTTGGKGLHVVAPILRKHGWEEVKRFTRGVAEGLVREEPRRYVATMSLASRRGKIFIDYLRNSRGATAVAPYSTRARPRAPVSTPLDWDELSPRIRSDHYTVMNLPRRLASLTRDPWEDLPTLSQKLGTATYFRSQGQPPISPPRGEEK